ncbi:hypothetical protein HDV01_001583 [Terramyces sp. JEL0728]|nr:hypothetical protein HDV01_001583 [Terramyces sp. JEL0728]
MTVTLIRSYSIGTIPWSYSLRQKEMNGHEEATLLSESNEFKLRYNGIDILIRLGKEQRFEFDGMEYTWSNDAETFLLKKSGEIIAEYRPSGGYKEAISTNCLMTLPDYEEPPAYTDRQSNFTLYELKKIKDDVTITLNSETIFHVQHRRHVARILTGLQLTAANKGSLWSMAGWSYNFKKKATSQPIYILDNLYSPEKKVYKVRFNLYQKNQSEIVFAIVQGLIFKWEWEGVELQWKRVFNRLELLVGEQVGAMFETNKFYISPEMTNLTDIVLVTGFAVSKWEPE